jgi:hypothetical protein
MSFSRRQRWKIGRAPVYAYAIIVAVVVLLWRKSSSADGTEFFKGRGALRLVGQSLSNLAWLEEEHSIETKSTPALDGSRYPGGAIVTLAGGDPSAKNLIALLRSLRDVKTELPVIVLLARGGLGSAACSNDKWKRSMNRSHIQCGGPHTIGEKK